MSVCSDQSPPRCTKCNSPPINGQCTNFILFDVAGTIITSALQRVNPPEAGKWVGLVTTSYSEEITGNPTYYRYLTLQRHIKAEEQDSDWYTGRWLVGCYIWYSNKGLGGLRLRPVLSSLY